MYILLLLPVGTALPKCSAHSYTSQMFMPLKSFVFFTKGKYCTSTVKPVFCLMKAGHKNVTTKKHSVVHKIKENWNHSSLFR